MRDALWAAARQSRLPHAQIEQELGLDEGYLKILFQGRVELQVGHVFGILRVLAIEPWKFFLWLRATEEAPKGQDHAASRPPA